MKPFSFLFLLHVLLAFGCKNSTVNKTEKAVEKPIAITEKRPVVSFTFDDGNTADITNFKFEEWNKMILSHLEKENLKAIFFVTGKNKLDHKGQYLLKSWNDQGHRLANHSFSHFNFNAQNNSAHIFENELIRTDSIITNYSNNIKLFRFPYLKEGQNFTKVDSIRNIHLAHNYFNGYVTIDASDWFIDQRLVQRIKEVGIEKTKINKYKDFYIQHIIERANYYEKLSYEMNGRHINHTLLLHHNLVSALFLDDLINEFKQKGWAVVNADTAYQDKIFEQIPKSNFAGESLIWSMAKESGKYDQSLRYPAEDSRYEKGKMNRLGL